jgi:hypothetical protein
VRQAEHDEQRQRRQLANRQQVQHERALLDTHQVETHDAQDDGGNHPAAGPSHAELGKIESQRVREHTHHRSPAADADEPGHPAHLERQEASERRARVEIWSARAVKAAARFSEIQRNRRRQQRNQSECDPAPGSERDRQHRRQRKHGAAYDLVHANGGEIPLSQRPAERGG